MHIHYHELMIIWILQGVVYGSHVSIKPVNIDM